MQECHIDMSLRISDQKNVDLVAGLLNMEQPYDMNLFQMIDYDLVASHSKKELRMTIVMRRKIMSEMMTTYFPSLLLMMITFATTFFKPFFFEAALSVNLTTMLVMTTIFISKMEGLPHTSDIKMIDIWLIFCQLVPFSEVVLLTAMEHLRYNDDLMMMGDKNGNITLKSPLMKQRQNTYIFVLKAIGMYLKSFMNALCVKFLFSERRALPVIAVLAFLAYSCLALYFYYN